MIKKLIILLAFLAMLSSVHAGLLDDISINCSQYSSSFELMDCSCNYTGSDIGIGDYNGTNIITVAGYSWDIVGNYGFWSDDYIHDSFYTGINVTPWCDDYEGLQFEYGVLITNKSNMGEYPIDFIYDVNCVTTTTTTPTTTTSTTTTTTTSTISTSPTSTISSTTTSTLYNYPYHLPDENYGTLPGLNGSAGTLPGSGVENITALGPKILGFETNKLLQWAAIFVSLGLLTIRPRLLGLSLSSFSVFFFTFVIPWNVYTASVCLIIAFIAIVEVVKEAYKSGGL